MNACANIALVLPGEAMWGAFQTGFALEFSAQLREAGHGENPIDLAVGSSSGSLVATVAAAGSTTDHDLALRAWTTFGRHTSQKREIARRLVHRDLANLYSDAVAEIFASGLIDTNRAFESQTAVVATATRFDKAQALAARSTGAHMLRDGLDFLTGGLPEVDPEHLAEEIARFLNSSAHIFTPHYFSSKPWPADHADPPPAHWLVTEEAEQLELAVKASSRIPFLYGPPIQRGGDTLIDGVYADNAPVEIALQYGAQHVFVVTSSRHGNVFERPIQSLALRQTHSTLHRIETIGLQLGRLPITRRAGHPLAEIGSLREALPRPAPVNLDDLRQRYPQQEIHVIHPPKGAPRVSRFFESRPAVFQRIYELGVAAAREAVRAL